MFVILTDRKTEIAIIVQRCILEKTAKTPKVIRGLFLAAFLGFVFSILLAKGATVLGFSAALPDWAVQSQTNSVLEGRKYQQFPKLSLSLLSMGTSRGNLSNTCQIWCRIAMTSL